MKQIQSVGSIERVLLTGDLSGLSEHDRIIYYSRVCESLGLNPFTQPFAYIKLNGKLTLYAKRDCCEQLRKLHGISIEVLKRQTDIELELYLVEVRAKDREGRTDQNIGAVSIGGLKGDSLANALMKCHTKAVRRVTLSLCGLGFLDETEAEDIPRKQVELPPVPEQPWKQWKSHQDALEWANKMLPSVSCEEIREWFEDLELVNGKKALSWYQLIIEMAAS